MFVIRVNFKNFCFSIVLKFYCYNLKREIVISINCMLSNYLQLFWRIKVFYFIYTLFVIKYLKVIPKPVFNQFLLLYMLKRHTKSSIFTHTLRFNTFNRFMSLKISLTLSTHLHMLTNRNASTLPITQLYVHFYVCVCVNIVIENWCRYAVSISTVTCMQP